MTPLFDAVEGALVGVGDMVGLLEPIMLDDTGVVLTLPVIAGGNPPLLVGLSVPPEIEPVVAREVGSDVGLGKELPAAVGAVYPGK